MNSMFLEPALPPQKKLDEYARELNLFLPLDRGELMKVREQVRRIKEKDPEVKKIHAWGKNPNLVLPHEYCFGKLLMSRSVIFADNGRAYIIHKVEKRDEGGNLLRSDTGKIMHAVGKGSYGEFRILQDVETGEFFEGAKIKILKGHVVESEMNQKSEIQRYMQRNVGTLMRRDPNKAPKFYDIIKRIPGKSLDQLLHETQISPNDRPYIILGELFEVINLNAMGICHHDLKEENIIFRKTEGSNVWTGESIDFDFSMKVNPLVEDLIYNSGAGTAPYVDESLTNKEVTAAHLLKFDCYSLARMMLHLFVPEAMEGPDRKKYRKDNGKGINVQVAVDEMNNRGFKREAHIIEALARTPVDDRWTATQAFMEMASIYPKETSEFLTVMLKMKCEALSKALKASNLPSYLQDNIKILEEILSELENWHPQKMDEATINEGLLKCRKADILNRYITTMTKYDSTVQTFNLTAQYVKTVLKLASDDETEFMGDYIYAYYNELFDLIDFGDLTEKFIQEINFFQESADSKTHKTQVNFICEDYLDGNMTYDKAKEQIDKIVKELVELKKRQSTAVVEIDTSSQVTPKPSEQTTQKSSVPVTPKPSAAILLKSLDASKLAKTPPLSEGSPDTLQARKKSEILKALDDYISKRGALDKLEQRTPGAGIRGAKQIIKTRAMQDAKTKLTALLQITPGDSKETRNLKRLLMDNINASAKELEEKREQQFGSLTAETKRKPSPPK